MGTSQQTHKKTIKVNRNHHQYKLNRQENNVEQSSTLRRDKIRQQFFHM